MVRGIGQMKDARTRMLVTSTSEEKSLAEILHTLKRGIVIFLKDAEMYLYFNIARFMVWKELRRRKRSENRDDE